MPKVPPHFDVDGVVKSVHEQDLGLICVTNDPRMFKATIYKVARRLNLPIHIYAFPHRPKRFALLKRKLESA